LLSHLPLLMGDYLAKSREPCFV